MELVRDGRHEIDAESRPGVYLLYIYLSAFDTLRKKWGNFTIFVSFSSAPMLYMKCWLQTKNNKELYDHVEGGCRGLKNELEARLETDCKTKSNWHANFKDPKKVVLRGEVSKVLPNISRQLSLKLSLDQYCTNNQLVGTPTPNHASYQKSRGDEIGSKSTVSGSLTLGSIVPKNHHVTSPTLSGNSDPSLLHKAYEGLSYDNSLDMTQNPLESFAGPYSLDNFGDSQDLDKTYEGLSYDNSLDTAQHPLESVAGPYGLDSFYDSQELDTVEFLNMWYVQPSSQYQGLWSS